jgi:proton-dependent oligopeptide transporter, POT family
MQPKTLYLLSFVQMWECFSYYGMRTLLVLYMVSKLGLSDPMAYGIYAVFAGLFELCGVGGNLLAERWLGLKRAIVIGSLFLIAGYLLLAFEVEFFLSLALIVVGGGLFNTNTTALLGLYYHLEDQRREEGFTLFYSSFNLGALAATLLCGFAGAYWGFSYGFALAGLGMGIGLTALLLLSPLLGDKGKAPGGGTWSVLLLLPVTAVVALAIQAESVALPLLPWIGLISFAFVACRFRKDLKSLFTLSTYLVALIIFYGAQEQIGSTLLLFVERQVDRSFLPAAALMSLNPMGVIILGPFVNYLCRKIRRGDESLFLFKRLISAFFIASFAFLLLFFLAGGEEKVPLFLFLPLIGLISLAEVMIGPAIYSACSEISAKFGFVMGLIPIGFSLANLFGGFLSKRIAEEASQGFGMISAILLIVAIILNLTLFIFYKRREVVL